MVPGRIKEERKGGLLPIVQELLVREEKFLQAAKYQMSTYTYLLLDALLGNVMRELKGRRVSGDGLRCSNNPSCYIRASFDKS